MLTAPAPLSRRHPRCQPGNEIERLKDDVCCAVSVRRLQPVTDVAVRRKRQTPLRDRRSTDVPAEPFELLALIRTCCDARVQRKSGDLPHPPTSNDASHAGSVCVIAKPVGVLRIAFQ